MGNGIGSDKGKLAAHVVWDWNGTLFHDFDAVIGATNAALAEIGAGPVTAGRYRELYCVPVPLFYQRLLGRQPTGTEWRSMEAAFRAHYGRQVANAALARGAKELLARRQAAGSTQSLCSLAPHRDLLPILRTHGIERRFVRVDGRLGETHTGKAEQMVRHLASLRGIRPERVVVIGDALDDAVAARHSGARAVLYTGGSNSRASLEPAGVPVVDSLEEAVETAESLVARPRPL
ncbi:HAD family hydrolase [Streptomyces sp. NPDC048845]|uniref:HAD family hydrolase n=1 Tax=Streptomyces sp. NPDC048845 TaxID=3155390 RepID=UPI00341239C4